jgi:hypothetical protein
MMLGSHFHIKPLLSFLDDAGPFWLLTISASHTRLYQGSRWDFTEAVGLHLPQGVAKVEGMTEYEETDYASPVGRRGGLAKAQSLGDDPDQIRKEELLELLHRIAPLVAPGQALPRSGHPCRPSRDPTSFPQSPARQGIDGGNIIIRNFIELFINMYSGVLGGHPIRNFTTRAGASLSPGFPE